MLLLGLPNTFLCLSVPVGINFVAKWSNREEDVEKEWSAYFNLFFFFFDTWFLTNLLDSSPLIPAKLYCFPVAARLCTRTGMMWECFDLGWALIYDHPSTLSVRFHKLGSLFCTMTQEPRPLDAVHPTPSLGRAHTLMLSLRRAHRPRVWRMFARPLPGVWIPIL